MRKYIPCLIIFLSISFVGCKNMGSQGKNFTSNVNKVAKTIENDSALLTFFEGRPSPLKEAFETIPTGENKPEGWLLKLMSEDLQHGMVGALDELYPGFKADDLYHTARRGGMEDIPEMGDLVLTGEEWETSIMWWNAETIGNWRDGFVRHAFLTGNKEAIEQSKKIVEGLLASQDDDGYIGIYKKNLRYQHEGSNGELWAQTTAFRMMLAYYEISKEKRVLDAVEKAMKLTMSRYNKDVRSPFDLKNGFGGVTHGLMMTDVCESLYRITAKQEYANYASYLYRAYSTYNVNRAFNDIRYPFLVKKDEPFSAHGVHTYEHLRSLLSAYYFTGYDELKIAYENALFKLNKCILPSGAGHAMEWIAELDADPTHTAAEFCSMLELRNFYGVAALKTGNIDFADQAEKLTFNAILGARDAEGKALTYGKADNCYKLDGKSMDGKEDETRYKYSPTHSQPAVCCVPNYTRNFSYFMDQMWGRKEDGFVAMLYGPCSLNTNFNGTKVGIKQKTEYPYSDEIEFEISPEKPISFRIQFRKPSWAKKILINGGEANFENGFYTLKRTWKKGDKIQLSFEYEVETKEFKSGELYVQRGPLVYAMEIPHKRKNFKDYALKGFHDYYCLAENHNHEKLVLPGANLKFQYINSGKPIIKGMAIDSGSGKAVKIKLVPMGQTVLRRVTFPTK
ncbi:MAG: glycoside hydrolase family 127 protein [Bacteroidia bacterium]|nr:glycoside hydrolase family 127 protein [Bacteroidia bacterium]